jgi:hypothetical protein
MCTLCIQICTLCIHCIYKVYTIYIHFICTCLPAHYSQTNVAVVFLFITSALCPTNSRHRRRRPASPDNPSQTFNGGTHHRRLSPLALRRCLRSTWALHRTHGDFISAQTPLARRSTLTSVITNTLISCALVDFMRSHVGLHLLLWPSVPLTSGLSSIIVSVAGHRRTGALVHRRIDGTDSAFSTE